MRDARIDELRGVACILVVLFHAIGSELALAGGGWGQAMQAMAYVRMPLFIGITGFLYGRRRASSPMTAKILYKRLARLLPPFLLLTLVCWAIDRLGGSATSLSHSLIHPLWHLWYIQALFVILAIMVLVDRTMRPQRATLGWLAVAAALLSASGWLADTTALSLNGAARLLPHFLFGALLGAYRPGALPGWWWWLFRIAATVAIAMVAAGLIGWGPAWAQTSLPGTMVGWCALAFLGALIPSSVLLARIGQASFPIFLWHLPLSAVLSGILLNPAHVAPLPAAAMRLAIGIAGPILIVVIVERFQPRLVLLVGRRIGSRIVRPYPG